tara:strand:+ start:928 stop:1230 length:303 start_codon:yes stop_codon:yes gene_type:complete
MSYKQMSKDEKIPLKYACVQPDIKKYMATFEKEVPPILWQHITDLYKLIDHQMKQQLKQESQITAVKHMEAWKRYDKDVKEYDPETRSYKKDKPGDAYKE